MTELTICIPDCHVPYHHKKALANVIRMIGKVRPDRVLILGDFLDMKAPARWSKGSAAEYAAGVDQEAKAGSALLGEIRSAAGEQPIDLIWGNHEARYLRYLRSYAPALVGVVRPLEELLELDRHGVVLRQQPYRLAPGVSAIHGEKLASSQNAAGQSAYKERARHGTSIVQGHTHRLGVGYDTQERTRFWLEAGWLGDIKRADYLSFAGVANWQLGFGWLRTSGGRVTPGVVPVHPDGSFVFDGAEYR